jgi:hypothetical protein
MHGFIESKISDLVYKTVEELLAADASQMNI